jgi:SSS family solute:Na+ symporter
VAESSILAMVSLLAPMFAAVYLPRTTSLGALLAMLLGMGSYIMAEYVFHTAFPALLIGFGVSVVALFLPGLKARI